MVHEKGQPRGLSFSLCQIFNKAAISGKLIYRSDNPVLTHPIILVVVELADIVIGWISGRNDLNDKVRRAVAALSSYAKGCIK